ncbi:unnamed protein product [Haemonchus placei]|uniref:Uncharacterized protein n=1 Tax=Haemonchus placei TaxID=6290 RepID=A0A0N4WHA3_HAEPC|nr:unnamed protein product [Haemonchus placei]
MDDINYSDLKDNLKKERIWLLYFHRNQWVLFPCHSIHSNSISTRNPDVILEEIVGGNANRMLFDEPSSNDAISICLVSDGIMEKIVEDLEVINRGI